MTAASPDTDDLEDAGFAVEAVVQILFAMSTSDTCRETAAALDLLAKHADGALVVIKAHVEATCEAKRQAAT